MQQLMAARKSRPVPSLPRRRLRLNTQLRNAFPESGAGRGREDARQDGRTRLPPGGRKRGPSDAPLPALPFPGRGAPRPHCATRPTGAHAWPPPTLRLRPRGARPPVPGPHPPPTRTEARRAQPWLRRPQRRRGDQARAGGRERPRRHRGRRAPALPESLGPPRRRRRSPVPRSPPIAADAAACGGGVADARRSTGRV